MAKYLDETGVEHLWEIIKTTFLPKSGGTVTGKIIRESGGTWISARDNVVVEQKKTTSSCFNPIIGTKTTSGYVALGNIGGDPALRLTYTTDTNYSNSTNENTWTVNFPTSDGTIALTNQITWSNLSGKPSSFTPSNHNHAAGDIISGTLAIARGGTGVTTQADINKAFVAALSEGTSDFTDNTEIITSYASNNGFADSNATNVPYKRDAIKLYNYVKGKLDSVYQSKLGSSWVGTSGVPVWYNGSNLQALNYLNHSSEGAPIILPFLSNDLAHFGARGGSITITGVSGTPDTTGLFDASPKYCFMNYSSASTSIVITLVLPTDMVYNYGEKFYIDFGSTSWVAKNITLQVYGRLANNSNSESLLRTESVTNLSGQPFWLATANPGGENKITKLVITLSNYTASNVVRVCQIGLVSYNSAGTRMGYMSRGVDDPVWRHITPATTETYSLGSPDYNWDQVHVEDTYTKSIISWKNGAPIHFYTRNSSGTWVDALDLSTTGLVMTYGTVYPSATDSCNLGTSSNRWQYLYLQDGGKIYAQTTEAFTLNHGSAQGVAYGIYSNTGAILELNNQIDINKNNGNTYGRRN